MMKNTHISTGLVLYFLLFILSVVIRFYNLQIPMLDDHEAATAMWGLDTASGFNADVGLSALLSFVFTIFGKSEFTARLIPAIFGSLIIYTPFLFKKYLGKATIFILSALLMFDPALIAYSRQVNGVIISVAGLVFAFGFFLNKKPLLAGIAGGFALLGSPSVWPGILSLGLAWWITSINPSKLAELKTEENSSEKDSLRPLLISGLLALIITIFMAGTVFFTHPEGFSAPLINLTSYLQGWSHSGDLSFLLFLASFFMYQPFALLMGLFEGIRANRNGDEVGVFLLRWFLLSTLLAVVYPSRGAESLVLSFIPLLALFSKFIARVWKNLEKPDLAGLGQMILVLLLIPFAWMNAIVLRFPIDGQEVTLRAAAVLGALALLAMSTVLIRFGWPPKQTETGLFLGFAILSVIFTFSTAWRSAGLGKHPQAELWRYGGVAEEMDLITLTAGDLSEWNFLSREGIDIVLVDYPSPSLQWALRDFPKLQSEQYLPTSANPSIIITQAENVPALAEAYRGQDFVYLKKTAWSLILPEEWIKWFAFREVPQENQQVILWARTDLFPGEKTNLSVVEINP